MAIFDRLRLYANGEKVLLVNGDTSFLISDYLVHSLAFETHAEDVVSYGSNSYVTSICTGYSVSFEVRSGRFDSVSEYQLSEFRPAWDMSIDELLKIVQIKLSQREEPNYEQSEN